MANERKPNVWLGNTEDDEPCEHVFKAHEVGGTFLVDPSCLTEEAIEIAKDMMDRCPSIDIYARGKMVAQVWLDAEEDEEETEDEESEEDAEL